MRAVERATRAELRALGGVASSALARVAIDLAQRLDADPGDRDAVPLARELRLALGELRAVAKEDVGGELERFLARISDTSLGDGSD